MFGSPADKSRLSELDRDAPFLASSCESRGRFEVKLSIGVGIVMTHDPLLGPGRALVSASGSYLR